MLQSVKKGTFHRNPKRKRGWMLRPSLTLRVTIRVNRVQYRFKIEQRSVSDYGDSGSVSKSASVAQLLAAMEMN